MGSSSLNDASIDRKLMPQRKSKRVLRMIRYKDEEEEEEGHNNEEEYYLQKIRELIDQKKERFAREDELSAQLIRKPALHNMDTDEKKKKKNGPNIIINDHHKIRKSPKPVVVNRVSDWLKEYVSEEMNGSDMKLVIQKILYVTDLTKSQNRLSMPINQLETKDFLTADERRDLDEEGKEFEVPLLGPSLRMHEKPMVLKMWHLQNSNNYVLKTNWYNFVAQNREHLKENTKIQVWSFRKHHKLYLAIACLDTPEPEAA